MGKRIRFKTALILMLIMLMSFGMSVFAAADEAEPDATLISGHDDGSEADPSLISGHDTESTIASTEKTTRAKAYGAGICIAVVAATGAIGMAISIRKALDGIARQPEAGGQIRTSLMLGLVFIETAIIYALIVAILLVFVL